MSQALCTPPGRGDWPEQHEPADITPAVHAGMEPTSSPLSRGRQELVKQMEQNAEEQAMRAEQRDQEAQELLEHLERLKMEDLKVRPVTSRGAGRGLELDFSPCWKGDPVLGKADLVCGDGRMRALLFWGS